ncbi:hypothetical protein HPB48_008610 [Haemaphysalis longicornis]|uniref:Uncharacterized protein n=1 Tax=Haemaphysalis longicornis TaxID=44386 RepID=A0A9J6GFY9_HAELO|nr:hypothetical protein HPB48_008610 [Haemaphysalis longicornis]
MLNLLGNLRKHFNARRVHIDGNVFRLYTSATVAFLLGFCTLLTAREYVGTPIDCHCPLCEAGVVNSFCWVESTFSHRSLFNASTTTALSIPVRGTGRRAAEAKTGSTTPTTSGSASSCSQCWPFYAPRGYGRPGKAAKFRITAHT